ncbi:hypothetical protein K9E66_12630 [Staphylococcus pseudintermedius]|nr:hypothetical protein K9E74_12695 [Staphylococcus pseudintermedius]USO11237.1 hypothetical protein K9E71_12570 [Staphylococcus pseudintermedius]USO11488.1 hypothetical protein K9E70_12560 [Staphylococcus pseudintermedius]USO12802.1 hypothetical protein K9E67_12705 [Staphylococcus pseudintermedius]USO15492.1 hypothetical protein K9E66_12630 [Staphylococcus pseudintermedius]
MACVGYVVDVELFGGGGVNSENVRQLIQRHPNIAGIDIASGIEKAKGQKDHDKMAYIVKVLKGE